MKLFNFKKSGNEYAWIKCPSCQYTMNERDFTDNMRICPKCGAYSRMTAFERIEITVDRDSFIPMPEELYSMDPAGFGQEYISKLKSDMKKTGLSDSILTGRAKIGGMDVAIAVMDFHFRGGSMGSVVGERIARLFELGCAKSLPVIIFTSSGGARMQEGILALMQMAKTTAARNRLADAGVPYITVLTDPTTGGVSASFAMTGDITLAESGAVIGFSGQRVIEQTIRKSLPPGFQSAHFSMEHGFVDAVLERGEIRDSLITILSLFKGGQKR